MSIYYILAIMQLFLFCALILSRLAKKEDFGAGSFLIPNCSVLQLI